MPALGTCFVYRRMPPVLGLGKYSLCGRRQDRTSSRLLQQEAVQGEVQLLRHRARRISCGRLHYPFCCLSLRVHFTVETDHRALTFLNSSKLHNSRLALWALQLQSDNSPSDTDPVHITLMVMLCHVRLQLMFLYLMDGLQFSTREMLCSAHRDCI